MLDGEIFWRFTARVERNPTRSGGRRIAAKVNGCLNSELGRANVSSIALAKEEAQRRWQSGRCRVHITHRYAADCGPGVPASDWLPPSPRFRLDKCDAGETYCRPSARRVRRLRRPETTLCAPRNRVEDPEFCVLLSQTVHHALKWPIVGVFD
jgi:hypothetical protein